MRNLVLEDSVAKGENGLQGLEGDDGSRNRRKNLVVLYDGGDHSDMVLKTV